MYHNHLAEKFFYNLKQGVSFPSNKLWYKPLARILSVVILFCMVCVLGLLILSNRIMSCMFRTKYVRTLARLLTPSLHHLFLFISERLILVLFAENNFNLKILHWHFIFFQTQMVFLASFLQNNRLEHIHQVMGYHPAYLEAFLKTQHYLMREDGPLPFAHRQYIAIMVRNHHLPLLEKVSQSMK